MRLKVIGRFALPGSNCVEEEIEGCTDVNVRMRVTGWLGGKFLKWPNEIAGGGAIFSVQVDPDDEPKNED